VIAGRYTLVSEIGRGGMGVVWRGVDEVLEREVALKRVGMIPGGASADLARAEREARLAASLNHPNVVAVFDLVTERDEQWLVMEYVENRTLAQLVREQGPLTPDEAAPFIHQAASALAAAHQAGIVHRDVKPSNILVTATGQVKLTDFGIARAHADVTLTQTGLMSGSPAYLSPEVASGSSAGAPSDVWALGATLFHALTGRPPFEVGGNVMGALYQIVHEDPPRPDDAGWLLPLLEATMTKDPSDRWSMVEVREFLARPAPTMAPASDSGDHTVMMTAPTPVAVPLASDAGPEEPVTRTPPVEPVARAAEPHEETRSKRWLLPALLVAALIVLVGLGIWALRPGDGTRPDAAADDTAATSSEDPTSDAAEPSAAEGESPSESESPSDSESPSETAPTGEATEDGMSTFVGDYLSTVTSDPDTTWTWLTSDFQRSTGGIGRYKGYWGTIQSAELVDVTADPETMSVTYTATYTRTDGSVVTEDNTLGLVLDGEEYLIASEG
jgi:serine/threonine protein kinase